MRVEAGWSSSSGVSAKGTQDLRRQARDLEQCSAPEAAGSESLQNIFNTTSLARNYIPEAQSNAAQPWEPYW